MRSLAEVEEFRKHGRVVIIAVHASPETRFKRLLKRGRPGDPGSYKEFAERDRTELEFGIGNVIALADYMIVNESSIEEAKAKALELLRMLVKAHGESDS